MTVAEAETTRVRGSAAPAPSRRRMRLPTRLGMGALSLVAVVGLASTFAGPTQESFATTVVATVRSGPTEVVYGHVETAKGTGMRGVKVSLYHAKNRRMVLDGSSVTSKSGLFRMTLRGDAREEFLHMRSGRTSSGRHFIVRPGHAYRVSGVIKGSKSLFFLPILSY